MCSSAPRSLAHSLTHLEEQAIQEMPAKSDFACAHQVVLELGVHVMAAHRQGHEHTQANHRQEHPHDGVCGAWLHVPQVVSWHVATNWVTIGQCEEELPELVGPTLLEHAAVHRVVHHRCTNERPPAHSANSFRSKC